MQALARGEHELFNGSYSLTVVKVVYSVVSFGKFRYRKYSPKNIAIHLHDGIIVSVSWINVPAQPVAQTTIGLTPASCEIFFYTKSNE